MTAYHPVIFFCLRPLAASGYPLPSVAVAKDAITNPFKIAERYVRATTLEGRKKAEARGVVGHLHFFRYVLKRVLNHVQSTKWKSKTPLEKRVDLWYSFAEPQVMHNKKNMLVEAGAFWKSVELDLANLDKEKVDEVTATDDIKKSSKKLTSLLYDHTTEKSERLLLFCFDEARDLTKLNIDGLAPHESVAKISQFWLLCRSLRIMS
jgi:hypothetical protein